MLICVTNRRLCSGNFLQRMEQLAQAKPHALLLREKDLDVHVYEQLASQVKEICERNGVLLIVHQNIAVAEKLKLSHVQLSMPALRPYRKTKHALCIGASVHSAAEATEAQALGADYLIAGHIYATDCKPGAMPRGLDFLAQVCQAVTLPVFAIGGIGADKVQAIMAAGAKGCCIMSEAMSYRCPAELVRNFAFNRQN